MTKEEHRALGIEYFNKAWEYIDKNPRSTEDAFLLLNYAHASKLHWTLSDPPIINIVRGEWMLSHCYSVLHIGEPALHHAQFCFDLTMEQNIKDFDLVFAYEAMARALSIVGNHEDSQRYLQLGYEAVNQVSDPDDKEYCLSELNAIKNNV